MLKNGKIILSIIILFGVLFGNVQGFAGSLESYYAGDFRKALSQFKIEIHQEQLSRLMLEQKVRFIMNVCAHLPELNLSDVEAILGEVRGQDAASLIRPSLEQRIEALHQFRARSSLSPKEAGALLDSAASSGNQASLLALSLHVEWQTRKSKSDSDWMFLLGKIKYQLKQGGRFYLEQYIQGSASRDPTHLKEAYQLLFDEISLDSSKGLSREDERLLARLKEVVRR